MELILDDNPANYHIRDYTHGKIRVNDTWYTQSLILSSDHLNDHWPPQTLETLAPEHFEPILLLNPRIVIIGTGETQQFIPPTLLRDLVDRQIGVEIMNTSAACRTFSVLCSEHREVVAALFLA